MGFLDHKTHIVYKIENTLNKKLYVGVTTKSIQDRWKYHIVASRTNKLALGAAIRKYGENNFKVSILENCNSKQHMLEQEKFWIKKLNTFAPTGHGYNMTLGGEGLFGYKHKTQAKKAMSEKRKGTLNHNYGKKWGRAEHPDEFLKMMSDRHSGEGNPMFRRKHSDKARKKIGEAQHRKVTQLDLEGNKMMEFSSIRDAANSLGCHSQNISRACRFPKTRTAAGYKWQYATGGVSSAS
tara:strand:- start:1512 stop:2225 length:714 start_codon:yes stop_codon:yes gene_type:complete